MFHDLFSDSPQNVEAPLEKWQNYLHALTNTTHIFEGTQKCH